MRIARVFPRRTNASPNDELAFFDAPGMFPIDCDEVHVSVTFSWDLPRAEQLAREWKHVAPVTIGGPATGQRGEDFTPGMYIKKGYVITSRGCPNTCWFCSVWKRDGDVRELPIHAGNNLLDDNLLACSDKHIQAVFDMLKTQSGVEFTGGLEAARLKSWHVEELVKVKPKQVFFAYDEESDYEPLREAVKLLDGSGIDSGHRLRAYCLIGYPKDTIEQAEHRLKQCCELGLFPMAMLWRNEHGHRDIKWSRFQRQWANPSIIGVMIKNMKKEAMAI